MPAFLTDTGVVLWMKCYPEDDWGAIRKEDIKFLSSYLFIKIYMKDLVANLHLKCVSISIDLNLFNVDKKKNTIFHKHRFL